MKQIARLLLLATVTQSVPWQAYGQTTTVVAPSQLPTGGKVVGGQVTLQSSGSTLNVNQTSQRGAVEWGSFNVGAQSRVNFNQPSASAVTLNRVLDMNASQILGRISATGQVFLTNPNGIIFGSTAQVDVGGLVATTKNINDADFFNGKTTFEGNGGSASVINQGMLQAALGGYIALLAPQVRNEGVIIAREGTVALAAGDKTTLEFTGNKLVSVIVDRAVIDALVENKQLIQADGGFVVMSARSANAILSSVINQTGTLQAPSLVQRDGRILLEGGDKGVVNAGGVMNVSGTQAGTTGGRIVVTGDKVAIKQDALLDATGQTGGGQINIGGGWQGQDPTIRQANATVVEAGARLDASAIQMGRGGEIVVWSNTQKTDGMTQVAGDLKARGGALEGDGGRIETSGRWLSTQGATGDASAPKGQGGQWLFDPYDITITSSTQNNSATAGSWTPSGTSSTIANTAINTLLDAGTNVTVSTGAAGSAGAEDGNITVNAAITQNSAAPAARLVLTANKNINIASDISMSKSGSKLELNAGNNSTAGSIALTGAVTADTLNMNLVGAGTVTQTTAVTANNLRINGENTAVTLNNTNNTVGVVAAKVASLDLTTQSGIDLGSTYGKGLYVSTVEGTSGITATGDVRLVSRESNIFVEQNIQTASTSATAIRMNAGEALSPGANIGADSAINPFGPNVVLTTGKTITTGTNGLATIYTGSSSGSGANLNTYIGAGSGRFRYNSDELTTNYSAALTSGLYAIYRQNPTLTIAANNTSMVYGAASTPTTSSTTTGYLNGDTYAQSVSTDASIAIAGARSGANYLTAGNHNLTASGAAGGLGYGFAYTDGTLAVTPKALTITATATGKTYDASAAATTALDSNKFQNDVVQLNSTSSLFNNKNAGAGKTVTVSGLSIAGADAANYTLSNTNATTSATIAAKALTASFTAADKIYNGNTTATVSGASSDIIAGDTVSFANTATFADKNVGIGKVVSISGVQLTGADAANYALSNTTASANASISAKALTASFNASNKVYDGLTTATVTGTSSGIEGTDVVTFANTSATFNDKNVDVNKAVSISGVTMGGAGAGNYTLANTTATSYANVTAKNITVSGITASDKTYDGSTSATVSTSAVNWGDLVVNDNVTISASGVFANKNVGTNKPVTLTSTYAGTDAGNYNITSQAQAYAAITPRVLAVTAIANNKTYDTTRTATYTLNSDKVTGDVLTLSAATAVFTDKNAAVDKTVNVGGIAVSGVDAGNYTLQNTSTSTTATINKAGLTVSGITAANKEYDQGVGATLTGTAAVTALQGDVVTLGGTGSATFADKNVGTAKAVNTTGYTISGTDASNYNLLTPTLHADITPKALRISGITAADKVYDGNATATVSTGGVVQTGLIAGDVVTVAATGNFRNSDNTANDKNVGTKTVQLASSYAGTDRGNYTITDQATTTANITAKALTIGGIAATDKVYDGNSTAAVSTNGVTKTGLITGDDVSVTATGNFRNSDNTANDKNVGTKTVQLVSNYGGLDRGNYAITDQTSTTANITAKALTISGITAANKVYDGNATATISTTGVNKAGLVIGDDVTMNATGNFRNSDNTANDKNVGTKTVQLASSYAGADRNNYTITSQATTTANITPKSLSVSGVTANNKIYDDTSTAALNGGVLTGLVSGDQVAVTSTGNFRNATDTANDKNVGLQKTVRIESVASGADVSNYTITGLSATTTANITPKPVDIAPLLPAVQLASLSLRETKVNLQAAPTPPTPQEPQAVASPVTTTPQPLILVQPLSSASHAAKSLTPKQVSQLPPEQLGAMLNALDRVQLLAITDSQINGLSVGQLNDLITLMNRIANPNKP
jgi:filamentous hemagglutinin family protein